MRKPPRSILISRADAIGDVVLTLPVAAILKQHFPHAKIGFLAKQYTSAVVEACPYVDVLVDADVALSGRKDSHVNEWDAIVHVFPHPRIAGWAKVSGIPTRIGTTNRLYHWWTCNRLVPLSRKSSALHEAQLNLNLLKPLGINEPFSLEKLGALSLLRPTAPIPAAVRSLIQTGRKNIILHPTSMGSAREWGLHNFEALARMLLDSGHAVFVTGTEKDGVVLAPLLDRLDTSVIDLTGRLSLAELIAFIAACDGLVAASTGPLHLAAALGIATVGLYPAERPLHAGRWAPLGKYAIYLVSEPLEVIAGRQQSSGLPGITPSAVFQALEEALEKKAVG